MLPGNTLFAMSKRCFHDENSHLAFAMLLSQALEDLVALQASQAESLCISKLYSSRQN